MASKTCTLCGRHLPIDQFDLIHHTTRRPRRRPQCHDCFGLYRRAQAANRRARQHNCPGTLTYHDVKRVLEAQRNCLACHSPLNPTIDHIVPLADGGPNTVDNLQVLCFECNTVKGATTADYSDPKRRYSLAERRVYA